MKKILVVIGSRANYGTAKSILKEIKQSKKCELVLVVSSSAVLDRFGDVSKLIEADGFDIDYKFFNLVEGNSLVTMPKSVGVTLIDLSNIFSQVNPDVVVTIGDRFETIATAIAASYLNIPLAHVMGGEVSGTIDESVRHAVTKLAHIHFPASKQSAERIIKMGENPDLVFNFGCPRIDEVDQIINEKVDFEYINKQINSFGVGSEIDIKLPFIILSYHPVTSEFSSTESQFEVILNEIETVGMQVIGLWPNADSGSEKISRMLRIWHKENNKHPLRLIKNLPTNLYFTLMNLTACQVGNSSSALREGSFIGTPAVNIGSRQNGREASENTIFVEHHGEEIRQSINFQLKHGKYQKSDLFGIGKAGKNIVRVLEETHIVTQKKIFY